MNLFDKETIRKIALFGCLIILFGLIFGLSEIDIKSADFLGANAYQATQGEQKTTEPSTGFSGGDVDVEDKKDDGEKPKVVYQKPKAKLSVELTPYGENILFEDGGEKKLPVASLVKLMTSLVALKNYNLDGQVKISKEAMAQIGEQGNLKEGEVLSVRDLIYITLIESSNRAAYAISEVVGQEEFISQMNHEAKALGMTNTYFTDSSGLDDKSYSTATDLVKLIKHLFSNYPLFREITAVKEYNLYLPNGKLHHKLSNTNELLGSLGIVGGKTGYTHLAGGCFITIQQKENQYVVHVVLGAQDRVLEMQNLISISHYQYPTSNSVN